MTSLSAAATQIGAAVATITAMREEGMVENAARLGTDVIGPRLREIAEPGDLRIVVRDEVWKQMRLGTAAVASFDADLPPISSLELDLDLDQPTQPGDLTPLSMEATRPIGLVPSSGRDDNSLDFDLPMTAPPSLSDRPPKDSDTTRVTVPASAV